MTDCEHDDDLTELLMSIDDHHFKRYDAGYHHLITYDVFVEWGFTDISIYIPYMWKRSTRPVKKEILELAYLKSQGAKTSTYGPRSLGFINLRGKDLPMEYLKNAHMTKDTYAELVKHSCSDWNKSCIKGRYIAGAYDLNCLKRKNVDIWGRNTYAILKREKTERSRDGSQ